MALLAQFNMQTTCFLQELHHQLPGGKNPKQTTTKHNNPWKPHRFPGFGVFLLAVLRAVNSHWIFPLRRQQIPEISQGQLLLKCHAVGGMLGTATCCTTGRCKLLCLRSQLWKQKPALSQVSSDGYRNYWKQLISTWNTTAANISFRYPPISSFNPPAEIVSAFLSTG